MSEKTFEEWHTRLTRLAKRHKVGWLIPSLENYPRDGYDEGLTPAEELSEQFSTVVN